MIIVRKLLLLTVAIGFLLAYVNIAQGVEFPFAVYKDQGPGNHYIASGKMGDTSDIRMTYASFKDPHSGTTCIRVIYTADMAQGAGWSGVYWQNPANNWGNKKGGYDLTGAKKLTFWVRGEKGSEIVEFKMGGIIGPHGDTDQASTGPIQLSSEWKEYTFDMSELDLSNIIGGFCFSLSGMDNPDGVIFYLDDIIYE